MAEIGMFGKDGLSLETLLPVAIKTPGVKINRAKFLGKELKQYCRREIIDEAIRTNPARAGIPRKVINKIAKSVINYETNKVSAISVVASLPGGAWAVGAASADIVSFFAHIIRVVQKLAYLYGFEQFDFSEEDMDSETLNQLLLFMGVMFGVEGTNKVLRTFADNYAKYLSKNVARQALTKHFIIL